MTECGAAWDDDGVEHVCCHEDRDHDGPHWCGSCSAEW